MKFLKPTDRSPTFKIECARYSFLILDRKWKRLRLQLVSIGGQSDFSEDQSVELLSDTWQVIDFAARFLNVLSSIRGIPRKDPRFQQAQKVAGIVRDVRNYIQHVDQEAHKLTGETYPILGALAWSSPNGRSSYVTWLGTLPSDTAFHTVGFDFVAGQYVDEVLLGVGNLTLKMGEVVDACAKGAELLDGWLEEQGLVDSKELGPCLLTAGPIADTGGKKRYARLKVKY